MTIKRIFNNNIALVMDDKGKEIILVGRGIVFGKRKGDCISINKADKVFELQGDEQHKFERLIQETPLEYVLLSEEIISYIKTHSDKKIDDKIYVTLTDHIANVVERVQMGIDFDMSVLLNVKSLYQTEYKLALHAVQMIREAIDIKLNDDEASFITLHIINAQSESNMMQISLITEILGELTEIVNAFFDLKTENNLDYDRFLVHCRFFVGRIVNNEYMNQTSLSNEDMFMVMKGKSPRQYMCILEISKHIKRKYNYVVNCEEEFYLLIHLNKLTK